MLWTLEMLLKNPSFLTGPWDWSGVVARNLHYSLPLEKELSIVSY
jgi:hypothetical protein